MGCDIHASIEYEHYKLNAERKKIEHREWWISFCTNIDIDRGYYLFTLLAGVRDIELRPIISPPRGMPESVSYEFKKWLKEWDADAHSTSWVTFKELQDWKATNLKELKLEYNPEENMKQQDFYKVLELLGNKYGDENVRLVFFFDN